MVRSDPVPSFLWGDGEDWLEMGARRVVVV
jgi:hypothetical protein